MNIFPKKGELAQSEDNSNQNSETKSAMAGPKPLSQLPSKSQSSVKPVQSTKPLEETFISADFTIIGNVISKQKVTVDGTIHGDMHCPSLIVAENANVIGNVIAKEITVAGRVVGSVFGNQTTLRSTAHVEGDIHHQGLSVELGAVFEGMSRGTEDPMMIAPKPDNLAEAALNRSHEANNNRQNGQRSPQLQSNMHRER